MADLRTDYKDDVLDTSVNEQRKYEIVQNDDGTVSLKDKTLYLQIGDDFGAAELNAICLAVNGLITQLGGWTIAVVDSLPAEEDREEKTLYLSRS